MKDSVNRFAELVTENHRLTVQLERTKKKSANRRTALKQMNRSLKINQQALELAVQRIDALEHEARLLSEDLIAAQKQLTRSQGGNAPRIAGRIG